MGNDVDNLSLSDRRAEAVAVALTEQFQVPAENLVTQGYGKQGLVIDGRPRAGQPARGNPAHYTADRSAGGELALIAVLRTIRGVIEHSRSRRRSDLNRSVRSTAAGYLTRLCDLLRSVPPGIR